MVIYWCVCLSKRRRQTKLPTQSLVVYGTLAQNLTRGMQESEGYFAISECVERACNDGVREDLVYLRWTAIVPWRRRAKAIGQGPCKSNSGDAAYSSLERLELINNHCLCVRVSGTNIHSAGPTAQQRRVCAQAVAAPDNEGSCLAVPYSGCQDFSSAFVKIFATPSSLPQRPHPSTLSNSPSSIAWLPDSVAAPSCCLDAWLSSSPPVAVHH